jgi:hypothetical protein
MWRVMSMASRVLTEKAQQLLLMVEEFDAERMAWPRQPYRQFVLHSAGLRRHHHYLVGVLEGLG